jgi:hypothetical protein
MTEHEGSDDVLLDLEGKSNDELRELLNALYKEEQEVSYRRRVLHGRIDILRAELVRRLKTQHCQGEPDTITGHDVDKLIRILSNDYRGMFDVDLPDDLKSEE